MTNFEWLLENRKELVKKYLINGNGLAIRKETEEYCRCRRINCDNCIFSGTGDCEKGVEQWLDAEHIDKPVDPHWEVDTKVLVSDDGVSWKKRYYAGFNATNAKCPYTAFREGRTSWTAKDCNVHNWKYAKLAEGEGEQE